VLKAWLRQFDHDPDNPFPGKGKMRPEEAELFRLKRELMKVTAERDILKKALVHSTGRCNTIQRGLHMKDESSGTNGSAGIERCAEGAVVG
jgi:transposase-like protein